MNEFHVSSFTQIGRLPASPTLAARFVGPKLLSFSRVPVQIKQLGNKIGGTGRKTLKSFHIEKNQVLDNTLI